MRNYLYLLLLLPFVLFAQPKEEVRAVWITTAFNLDYPKTSGQADQQKEMISLLDKLKLANFNTIFFQVRARGDLFYPSAIEPWAKSLTGTLGKDPGYDPLQFIIEQAHNRGMEVHAWWNVYKVWGKGEPEESSPEHIALLHPEYCKNYKGEIWLDPGIPEVKNYLLGLVTEMIRKYDLDGLHLDYIRYPNTDFNDMDTYNKYGKGKKKEEWRRNIITDFVESAFDSVKNIKPFIKVGCSTIGVYYKNFTESKGWDAFNAVSQDVDRWIKDNKVDYIAPQTYWSIKGHPSFIVVNKQWENLKKINLQVYPGLAVYKLNKAYGDWPVNEILNQIDTLRKNNTDGIAFFRSEDIIQNKKNIYTYLKEKSFKYPANIPPINDKDSLKPPAPLGLTFFKNSSSSFSFYWSKSNSGKISESNSGYYNIYIDRVSPVDLSQPKNLLALRIPSDQTVKTLDLSSFPDGHYFICVTAIDRFNNESLPSNEISITIVNDSSEVTISK